MFIDLGNSLPFKELLKFSLPWLLGMMMKLVASSKSFLGELLFSCTIHTK